MNIDINKHQLLQLYGILTDILIKDISSDFGRTETEISCILNKLFKAYEKVIYNEI